jgi:hypothetical protein
MRKKSETKKLVSDDANHEVEETEEVKCENQRQ